MVKTWKEAKRITTGELSVLRDVSALYFSKKVAFLR